MIAAIVSGGLVLLLASGQTTLRVRPNEHGYEKYGDAIPLDLWELARSPSRYQKQVVRTSGWVDPFDGPFMRLHERGAAVILLPTPEMDFVVRDHMGRRVEIVGVVRRLTKPQEPCGYEHWSKCEDPDLPQLPDLTDDRYGWPRVSVTAWAITDLTERRPEDAEAGGRDLLESVAGRPEDYTGKTLTLVGQFRGHNLFGDLPQRAWGDEDDWVIKSGDHAVWVTGKKPRGKGWKLALDYEPDTRFWLEITGEIVAIGDVACVKAKSVAMTKAPGP
jgi:hypothetical protein